MSKWLIFTKGKVSMLFSSILIGLDSVFTQDSRGKFMLGKYKEWQSWPNPCRFIELAGIIWTGSTFLPIIKDFGCDFKAISTKDLEDS